MTIHRLTERPDLAVETAALMTQIWPGHYGAHGEGNALSDVLQRIDEDRAAIALQDGVVVGTVALRDESFGAKRNEGPWLVGLCTDPSRRGQGIGSALTTWAMGKARQQERTALYACTQDAAGIFDRLGWDQLRMVTEDSGSWSIWRVDLSDD